MNSSNRFIRSLTSTALGAALLCAPALALADDFPECKAPLGTLRVAESSANGRWWEEAALPEPSRLIKVFVQQSRCFRLVDRGLGMDLAREERELAASGELQAGSNIGLGQTLAADYVLVPDVVMANENAAGGGLNARADTNGGGLGGMFGRGKQADAQLGMSFQSKRAHVVLTAVDVRTSELLGTADAVASKSDKRFNFGGNFGKMLSLNAGGYVNTEMGQVVALAYAKAYTALIEQIQENRLGGAKRRGVMGKGAQWALALASGGLVPPPMTEAQQRKLDERRGIKPVEQLSAAEAAPQAQPLPAQAPAPVAPPAAPVQAYVAAAPAPAPTPLAPAANPSPASAAAPVQALMVTRVGRLLSDAQGSSAVRTLNPGMFLYPTGNKEGLLIEVDDELGNRGWVNSQFVELAK